MPETSDPYAHFRLELEQQRQRAKDLIHAARAGNSAARRRLADALAPRVPDVEALTLTDAQFAIARELGAASWHDLRAHVMAQAVARRAISRHGPALDADMPTLHIRCGSDITRALEAARFAGELLEVWDPFTVGPVTDAPDWMARRASFHAEANTATALGYDRFVAELTAADRRLAASAEEYDRVVIWTEHDSHDQLSLIRCLAHYARTKPPRVLELISVNHFPGSQRFIGLGQLPPEAMWMLWNRREVVDAKRLSLGAAAWAAVTADDPRALAGIVRTATPELPHLAPALHRHLQELPAPASGLGLTQALLLQILSRQPATVGNMWHILQGELEPLPFLGDTMFLHILDDLGRAHPAVYERTVFDQDRPFSDRLTMTTTGQAVLRGAIDWLSLHPPVRWIGGVRIDPSRPNWRWDEAGQVVTLA